MKRTRNNINKLDQGNKEEPIFDPMEELGETGLRQFSGVINEEFLVQLKGQKKIQIYKEMRDNDPVVGAILFATDMLLRNVDWTVQPATEAPRDIEVAEFVNSCKDDMSHTWTEFISETLSMLSFGYSVHEIVYKLRKGPDSLDRHHKSNFNDGKIGWAKLPIRSQDTLQKWYISENGDIDGLQQLPPNISGFRDIPWEKLLLFRTNSHKNNPEGRSVLRNAYRPWYFKKRIEEIEGVGIERDLAGLPIAKVPPEIMSSDATNAQKQVFKAIKDIVRNVRRNEQEGIVFPLMYDDNGNEMYRMELLTTGGQRQFDTSKIVTRYDQRIAMTILADFILLGHDAVGSFALSSDKTSLYATALGAWLNGIEETLNRFAIPRLLILNNIPQEAAPKFKSSDIEKKDIEKWTMSIERMLTSGAMIWNEELDAAVKNELDLPITEENGR